MKLLRRIVAPLLSACLIATTLPGCAQLPGAENLTVSPSDPCGVQRRNFAESQSYFTQEIAVRAVTGAAIGAGTGAVIGAMTGNARNAGLGALAGAVAGGALGLMSGYYDKLQQQNLDQQQLALTVNHDLQYESSEIDHTTATFASLRSCRFAQATQIKSEARRGIIPRGVAEAELAQERAWFDQEVQVAENAGVNMQKRDEQFTYAANNLKPSGGSGPPQRTTRTTTRTTTRNVARSGDPAQAATVAATETIPQKRNSFENEVQVAQAQSSSTFNLDTTSSRAEFPRDA